MSQLPSLSSVFIVITLHCNFSQTSKFELFCFFSELMCAWVSKPASSQQGYSSTLGLSGALGHEKNSTKCQVLVQIVDLLQIC